MNKAAILAQLRQLTLALGGIDDGPRLTVKALCEWWAEQERGRLDQPGRGTWQQYTTRARNLARLLGTIPVADLTPTFVRRNYIEPRIAEGVMEFTADMEVTLLRSMVRMAIGARKLHSDPLVGIKLRGRPNARDTVYSPHQIAEIIRLADGPAVRAVFVAALDCGIRPKEFRHTKRVDVDLRSGVLVIPASVSKNKRRRLVRISERLIDCILQLPRERPDGTPREYLIESRAPTGKWIPMAACALLRRWRRTCWAVGIDPATHHLYSAKHTSATMLAEAGATIPELQAHLGHTGLRHVTKYMRTREVAAESARAKVDAIMAATRGRRPPVRVEPLADGAHLRRGRR